MLLNGNAAVNQYGEKKRSVKEVVILSAAKDLLFNSRAARSRSSLRSDDDR